MKEFPRKNFLLFACLVAGSVLFTPRPALTQTEAGPSAAPSTSPEIVLSDAQPTGNAEPFVYKREGRPDPFFPFLTQELLKAETKALQELTGTQKFEPGQLTLVAIVISGAESLAMVQDAAGIGYILRKGSKIGRSGRVVDILPNKVFIEEPSKNIDSEEKAKLFEMTLKKEGE